MERVASVCQMCSGQCDIYVMVDNLPGVLFLSYGWGQPYAAAEGGETGPDAYANVNLLTDAFHYDPVSGTTANRSILVRIRKL